MKYTVQWKKRDDGTLHARITVNTLITPRPGEDIGQIQRIAESRFREFMVGDALNVYLEIADLLRRMVNQQNAQYAQDLLSKLAAALTPDFEHEAIREGKTPVTPKTDNPELDKLIASNSRMFFRAILKKLPDLGLAATAMDAAGMSEGDIALRFLVASLVKDEQIQRAFMQEFIVTTMNDPDLGPVIHGLVETLHRISQQR